VKPRATNRPYLSKFRCPICRELTTSHVLEGRMDRKAGYYWRRRECDGCGEQFTTKELLDPICRPSLPSQHLES
jgi:transcription elongation factor Elf1